MVDSSFSVMTKFSCFASSSCIFQTDIPWIEHEVKVALIKIVPMSMAPLRLALLSMASLRLALLSVAPLRSASMSVALLRLAPLRSAALMVALLRLAPLRSALLRSALLRLAPLRSAPLRSAPLKSDLTSGCCFLQVFHMLLPCCRSSRCCWFAMTSFPPLSALYYTCPRIAQQGLSSFPCDGGVNYAKTTTGRVRCGYPYSEHALYR